MVNTTVQYYILELIIGERLAYIQLYFNNITYLFTYLIMWVTLAANDSPTSQPL